MSASLIATLFSDMNAAAKRISNGSVVAELSDAEVLQVKQRLDAYSPKTKSGTDSKRKAQGVINATINERGISVDEPVEAVETPAAEVVEQPVAPIAEPEVVSEITPAPQPAATITKRSKRKAAEVPAATPAAPAEAAKPARRKAVKKEESPVVAAVVENLKKAKKPKDPNAKPAKPEIQLPLDVQLQPVKENTFDAVAAGEKLAKTSFVFEVHVRQPGFQKKVDAKEFLNRNTNVGADADASVITLSKSLIDRKNTEVLKELAQLRSNYLASLKGWSVPGGLLTLGNGQYLLSTQMVQRVRERTETFISERALLLDKFEENYEAIKEKSKASLTPLGLYNEEDFPSFAIIRSKYTVDYKCIGNQVPEELKKASADIWKAEVDRMRVECAATAQEVRDVLRMEAQDLVDNLVSRLGIDEKTGKPRVFHASRIEALNEFLELLKARDLTNDSSLVHIMEQAKKLVDGVNAKDIRKHEPLREALHANFVKIKEHADQLITVRSRRFKLEDEDE
jgi:hypothetical protein